MNSKYKLIIKGLALLGIVGLLSSCGGSGSAAGRAPVDNFDSGALASGLWIESLGGGRSIENGRLVETVTSSGTQETVRLHFTGDPSIWRPQFAFLVPV